MKKILVVSLALLLAALNGTSVFARGSRDSGGTGAAPRPITIRVWSNDAHNREEFTQIIAKFNNGRGAEIGVQIDYTVYGADYQQALDIAVRAGDEPEIFKPGNQQAQHVIQGRLLKWTEVPGIETLLKNQEPFHIKNATVFGDTNDIYSVALYQWVDGLHYNKDLLRRAGYSVPPKTWAEWEEACVTISQLEPGKIYGYAIPLGYSDYHNWMVHYPAIPSVGHYWYDYSTQKYNFSDFGPYLDLIRRLIDKKAMWPGIESLDDDQMRAQFAEGNLGFIIGGAWNVGVLYDQFPAKVAWGVMPFPVRDSGRAYATMSSAGNSYSISAQVKNKGQDFLKAVGEVINVFCGDELQGLLYTTAKNMPLRQDVIAKAAPPARPQWGEFAAANPQVVPVPILPDYFLQLEGANNFTVFSAIITGQADTGTALADLDRRYNAALERAFASGVIKKEDFTDPGFAQRFRLR